jgi:transmembrane protein 70
MWKFCRKTRAFFPLISHQRNGFSLHEGSSTLTGYTQRSINVVSSSAPCFKTRENRQTFRQKSDSVESIAERQLVYEGPLSRSVQLVKVFSLSTALATVVATPILMIYGKESVPVIGKMAIAATILVAGTSTTFLLHWMTKVYVHKMFYNAATETFIVETMSMLARRKETEFKLNEIRLAKEPTAFTTFQAQGKKYFLHTDLLEAQQVLQFIRENRI